MDELNIKLNFNSQDFWDIYYPNNQNTLLRNSHTRRIILYAGISVLVSLIIYLISFRFPRYSWLILFTQLINVGFFLYATIIAIKFVKRKNNIKTFLKDLSQYSSFYLLLAVNAVEIGMDSKITIDKWSNISSAQLNENYIQIFNKEGPLYIFPAKSMSPDEFNQLKALIKSKVQ